MTDEQVALSTGDPVGRPASPHTKLCGDPGPYAVRRPTPKQPFRLEVLTCTRPPGHGMPSHEYAEPDGRILAAWSLAGRPIHPRPIEGV